MRYDTLYHGAAYYPELWDKETMRDDIAKMKDLGINVVRMGEFAWAKMEPSEGVYDFQWLKDAVALLHENGIESVLCTPTPTPPGWLTKKHPEVLGKTREGVVFSHGGRQHACYTGEVFRAYSRKITRAIAEAFRGNSAVIAWQTDNEFLCHKDLCFCDACCAEWTRYLHERYGTIERLNDLWGTDIWSERYELFEDVPPPLPQPFGKHNTSLETRYRQFTSDMVIRFQKEQVDIIREYTDAPITHNSLPPFRPLDHEALFNDLDFAGVDVYFKYQDFAEIFMTLNYYRTIKRDTPFWIVETAANHPGALSVSYGSQHPKGFLAAFAFLTYAAGGNGFCYWLWRQQRTGAEILHGSLLHSCGRPTTGWNEAAQVSTMRAKMEPILAQYRRVPADIAIMRSIKDGDFFFATEETRPAFSPSQELTDLSSLLSETGHYHDVILSGADISAYKVVFTPFMPHMPKALLEKLRAFVEAGGTWVFGPMAGYRTEEHTVPVNGILGDFEDVTGITAKYVTSLYETDSTVSILEGDEKTVHEYAVAFDVSDDDKVLGHYEVGILEGEVAAVERALGKGRVIALGCEINEEREIDTLFVSIARRTLFTCYTAFDDEETSPPMVIPFESGVDERHAYAVANVTGEDGGRLFLEGEYRCLLTDEVFEGEMPVSYYAYHFVVPV